MKAKIEVEVTKEHLRNGYRSNCKKCPIALAIKDGLAPEDADKDVIVRHRYVKIGKFSYALPLKAQDFIVRYDAWEIGKVKPFKFTLIRLKETLS